ncbi:hypothetical protein K470DRAFT_256098 [Piedraia hortae CBS 480.64]|uniref:Uncharacterized protein n=1 Tax=Piedraia hortae CBS 480.64 TaxID=1314780 RepID=A0A6A7C720_9PEZI|nr:hypothetical protein K470DRAFT_256098 [Piedraia hortae CBS 480.64]
MPPLLRRRSVLDFVSAREEFDANGHASPPTPAGAKRFSLLKLRNFSEPQLASPARLNPDEDEVPPLPPQPNGPPTILKTVPTLERPANGEQEPQPDKRSVTQPKKHPGTMKRAKSKTSFRRWPRLQSNKSSGLADLERLAQLNAPPLYGDESSSALALPISDPRASESSRSDGSSASFADHVYGQTTTTTQTVSTTHTTFFKLPRGMKRNSLLPRSSPSPAESELATPRASGVRSATELGSPVSRQKADSTPTKLGQSPSPRAMLARGALSFAEPGLGLFRTDSTRSRQSSGASPLQQQQQPPPWPISGQSSWSASSPGERRLSDGDTSAPQLERDSTSTSGRPSLGGIFHLARFRQNSEPRPSRRGSPTSRSDSFNVPRAQLTIPEREDGETPGKYLERLEAAVSRSMIASILSKSADPFAHAVLRSYTRRFPFFGEPIDMSLRKFILEAELPKETQQVDRVIQAFADRYNECNPGIFLWPDQAYIVAFSLMMLHTDVFNKNNKRKMQKLDYIKNTSGQHVADEILACFYDNICYTPFVHCEEDADLRVMQVQPKRKKLKEGSNQKPGLMHPYNLIVDQKLDQLRPNLKHILSCDDPYNYRGTADLDPVYLQRAFTHTGILQIISARSRPSAFEERQINSSPSPMDTRAGIIDLKITKVGVLWRKSPRRKTARSPWQEWGAILTGSQLYLFKNSHWAKGLLNQFLSQQKPGQPRTPVIFKPPLLQFKPDALIKTDTSVALIDSTYSRHRNGFTFFRPNGEEEVLLADNEAERNDWLALINYAAAFRAAGVRIRGMLGGNDEDLRRQDPQSTSSHSDQLPSGEVAVVRNEVSPQLQSQIMATRRHVMVQKITELERHLTETNKHLDALLRNARHLLVLAPIGPKTREDVVQAAMRADSLIRWYRREIWRMNCYRDILVMDILQSDD